MNEFMVQYGGLLFSGTGLLVFAGIFIYQYLIHKPSKLSERPIEEEYTIYSNDSESTEILFI